MNLAYYVVVFDRGTDAWLEMAGLGNAYRAGEGCSVFAVETHTLYRREVSLGDALAVRSWLVAADAKRLHLAHEMRCGETMVAMQEVLFVHVDLATRRVSPLAAAKASDVTALVGAAPPWLGRRVELTPGAALIRS